MGAYLMTWLDLLQGAGWGQPFPKFNAEKVVTWVGQKPDIKL